MIPLGPPGEGTRTDPVATGLREPHRLLDPLPAARLMLGGTAPAAAPGPAAPASVADELAKLAQLRDSGALTDEEFAAQKARLLGS